jgi:hypothetical protein
MTLFARSQAAYFLFHSWFHFLGSTTLAERTGETELRGTLQ